MKYLLLLPAAFLDFLQFMFFLAFLALQAITPAGGGVGGAAAGAAFCYNASTGVISGLIEGAKCAVGAGLIGAGASAFAVPLGMAVNATLSLAFGGALLLLLAFSGMFYLDLVIAGFFGEAVPFINFFPIWTGITWACIRRKSKEEKKGVSRGGMIKTALGFIRAAPGTGRLKDKAQELEERRFSPQNQPDIRPARQHA